VVKQNVKEHFSPEFVDDISQLYPATRLVNFPISGTSTLSPDNFLVGSEP
jgi:hypothetical protein